jgi:hypothetical protein
VVTVAVLGLDQAVKALMRRILWLAWYVTYTTFDASTAITKGLKKRAAVPTPSALQHAVPVVPPPASVPTVASGKRKRILLLFESAT